MSMNKPGCLGKVPTEVYLKTEIKYDSNTVDQPNTLRPEKVNVAKLVPNPNKQVCNLKKGISRHQEET